MTRPCSLLLPLVAAGVLAGCGADLVVEDLTVDWTGASRTAEATVRNVGNQPAGEFLVYFDADEFPESPNHRPQLRENVASLDAGAATTLQADFAPLAHPDNQQLGNVYQITVTADPKRTVDELDDDNNEERLPTTPSTVELRDRNDVLVPENPAPLAETRLPVLFVHGHNLLDATDQDPNYRRNWQDPLDYPVLLRLPSFAIALDLPANAPLAIEPYYIRLQDQDRSITDDAAAIGEAVTRILRRHGDPTGAMVKVAIIAYSKGTLSSRWYLEHMLPASQPVSELVAIAPPNHGLAGDASLTGASLAFRQINNGHDDQCVSFGEAESEHFIERLNGHPIEDTGTDPAQGAPHPGEAPRSRVDGAPVDQGVLHVTLYANDNRDAIGGSTASGDCQGRIVARNLAADAVNLEVNEIAGFTEEGVHVNTVHTPEVICLALHTVTRHEAPLASTSCATQEVDGRDVPVIPAP